MFYCPPEPTKFNMTAKIMPDELRLLPENFTIRLADSSEGKIAFFKQNFYIDGKVQLKG